ncbi:DUF6343 family protein [Streptomyces sp. RB6PN25]|uniref:DUF6343 family protein n=1 Tax=Streptomyces humicola TaxID=2953240 RepID=A0ABT1Q1H6_9ACTN|nr:DUF6343 family protein [Streptomyces humicola]MCQ4083757.1 DUF6343 family protein [Streptomyces humicola]
MTGGTSDGRRRRTGTEPVAARSALGLRMVLSAVYVPIFVAGAIAFAIWATRSAPGGSPGVTVLDVLAGVSAALAAVAAADLLVVSRRRRRAGTCPTSGSGGGRRDGERRSP